MLPTKTGIITTPYKARGSAWSDGIHKGVDLRARKGDPVYSPWHGTVLSIGTWGSAFGSQSPVIAFDRLPDGKPGYWGVMAHLDRCIVKPGQRVKAGQQVGTGGDRGNAFGAHLHFEVHSGPRWSRTTYMDPARYLNAKDKPVAKPKPKGMFMKRSVVSGSKGQSIPSKSWVPLKFDVKSSTTNKTSAIGKNQVVEIGLTMDIPTGNGRPSFVKIGLAHFKGGKMVVLKRQTIGVGNSPNWSSVTTMVTNTQLPIMACVYHDGAKALTSSKRSIEIIA